MPLCAFERGAGIWLRPSELTWPVWLWAHGQDMLSVLSVGPGYRDDKIRPWNAHNTRERNGEACTSHALILL
jgi:hypothetical protein